jgi:hypothetical protein
LHLNILATNFQELKRTFAFKFLNPSYLITRLSLEEWPR